MKKTVLIALLSLVLAGCAQKVKVECSVPYKVENGMIVTKTPERAPGQQNALSLRCEPLDTVRIGMVGIGSRARGTLQRFLQIEGCVITAVCDKIPEKTQWAAETVAAAGFPEPAMYSGEEGYKELCEREDVDMVYVCTDWLHHVPVSIYAMEHGKHACMEVPAATNLADCWALVDACERTRKHCMMMENVCYHRFPLLTLNMAKKGLFGEIYFAQGAYIHNLGDQAGYQDNWRLEFNQAHRGDNYPTHGLGPLCQIMDIHRGDKMDVLVAVDSKSIRGLDAAKRRMGSETFAEGDHVVTLIKTHNGHEIEIQHNVYAPRQYSRIHSLTGTEGYVAHFDQKMFCLKTENLPDKEVYKGFDGEKSMTEFKNADAYNELWKDYIHPLTALFEDDEKETGIHSSRMDYIMQWRLIYCLRHGLPLDQDVYDAAEWSCPVELTRLSLESGYLPVEIPDFTRGEWNVVQGYNNLDTVDFSL